jgi:hypothetical protein
MTGFVLYKIKARPSKLFSQLEMKLEAALVFTLAQAQWPGNLIENSSFEKGGSFSCGKGLFGVRNQSCTSEDSALLSPWVSNDKGRNRFEMTSTAHSGFWGMDLNTDGPITLQQTVTKGIQTGAKYVFRFHYQATTLFSKEARYFVRDVASGQDIVTDKFSSSGLFDKWHTIEVTFTSPSDSIIVGVKSESDGNAGLMVDDFELILTEAPVPKTTTVQVPITTTVVVVPTTTATTTEVVEPTTTTEVVAEPTTTTEVVEPTTTTEVVAEPTTTTEVAVEPTTTEVVAEPTTTEVVESTTTTEVVESTTTTEVVAEPTTTEVVAEPTTTEVVAELTTTTEVVEPTTTTEVVESTTTTDSQTTTTEVVESTTTTESQTTTTDVVNSTTTTGSQTTTTDVVNSTTTTGSQTTTTDVVNSTTTTGSQTSTTVIVNSTTATDSQTTTTVIVNSTTATDSQTTTTEVVPTTVVSESSTCTDTYVVQTTENPVITSSYKVEEGKASASVVYVTGGDQYSTEEVTPLKPTDCDETNPSTPTNYENNESKSPNPYGAEEPQGKAPESPLPTGVYDDMKPSSATKSFVDTLVLIVGLLLV